MRPIRVLRVIARMNVGGPALQVAGLAEGLDPERFEHRILVGDVEADEADYVALRAPHVEVTRIPGLGRSVNTLGDARALRSLVGEVRRFRPDIVHTHTAKAGVLGRVAARAVPRTATVHTFHGHLLHGYFSPTVTKAVIATERTLAHGTTALIAVGARVRDDLLAAKIGRRDQYTVVPPGVPIGEPADPAAARASLGLSAGEPVVSFVARLTAVKRPDRFLAVAEAVLRARPDTRFIVAGEGPLLEELRTGAARLGDRIVLLGWRPDVETVYAASDVVLLTSDNEGMPVSLIEAAAAGRPAVSTDVGSVAEVVEQGVTGLVVGLDVDALASAVLELLGDDERRRAMGAAAAERARARFSRQRLVDDVAAVYEKIVAGGA